MKAVSASVLTLLLSGVLLAQGDDLRAKYDAKMKKDFVSKIAWEQNLETAKKKAATDNKLIVAYFTRSYAP